MNFKGKKRRKLFSNIQKTFGKVVRKFTQLESLNYDTTQLGVSAPVSPHVVRSTSLKRWQYR